MRYIGVLDCNNFFVSCERLFRPDLRRRPVVVLSSNDGCIVARSQEIKDKGIPMGVPYFQVKELIKDIDAVCFSSHFALYRDVSARVFATMRTLTPDMEMYSIDEAFFQFEAAGDEAARQLATTLKTRVERAVGIPVSVGVSDTKTRAKLVNDTAKKSSGVALSVGSDFLTTYGDRSLREVWGIGRQLQVRYQKAGIQTIADMVGLGSASMQHIGQIVGRRLQAELQGVIAYPVQRDTHTLPKSAMSTRSFRQKTNKKAVITDALAYHIRTVMADLRGQGLVASHLTVLLYASRHGDYRLRGGTVTHTFAVPLDDTLEALKAALVCLDSLYEQAVPYTKTGVVVTGLMPKKLVPVSLFAAPNDRPVLDQLIDGINARLGREVVQIGRYEKVPTWTAKRDLISPAYTTQWSALPIVRAL
jgi:DNA polymerase V